MKNWLYQTAPSHETSLTIALTITLVVHIFAGLVTLDITVFGEPLSSHLTSVWNYGVVASSGILCVAKRHEIWREIRNLFAIWFLTGPALFPVFWVYYVRLHSGERLTAGANYYLFMTILFQLVVLVLGGLCRASVHWFSDNGMNKQGDEEPSDHH